MNNLILLIFIVSSWGTSLLGRDYSPLEQILERAEAGKVVIIDLDVANRPQVKIDHPMASDLIEHVFEERNPGVQRRFPRAV